VVKKKVSVLTYTTKHRKTFDTLSLLRANGYADVAVYAVPFHYEKKKYPMIYHRPEMNYELPEIQELCSNFGYHYEEGQLDAFNIESDRVVLVAGAGILPKDFIDSHTVINAHPGYIPNCRGLDALKWAIFENEPVGVTTHLIGEYIDAGQVIERRKIDVYKTDTFHALAQRVYENEVSMLVEAIKNYDSHTLETIYPSGYEIHKRMPEELEKNLIDKFDAYKVAHGKNRLGG